LVDLKESALVSAGNQGHQDMRHAIVIGTKELQFVLNRWSDTENKNKGAG